MRSPLSMGMFLAGSVAWLLGLAAVMLRGDELLPTLVAMTGLGVAVLAKWRIKWLPVGCLVAGAVVLAGIVTAPTIGDLTEQGDGLRAQIEGYHKLSGRFPVDLDAPGTRFGNWRYETDLEGSRYTLEVGDYGRFGFELYLDSDRKDWYVDR